MDDVPRGEPVEKCLGFRSIDGQLDHDIQVLGEPGVSVIRGRHAAGEVKLETQFVEDRRDSLNAVLKSETGH